MFAKLIDQLKGKRDPTVKTPEIMGLRLGASFELDPLAIRLILDELTIESCSPTQIIRAAGVVELDGTWVYRFYTDDDAWLQVVAEGGQGDEHVVDVKLFHFYDTLDVADQQAWDNLLKQEIGTERYQLRDRSYSRVWTSAGDYHNPVHMSEKTYDVGGDYSVTDQFTMLFERELSDQRTESLFLSAEEKEEAAGYLSRSLVISTGITLTSSQLTIHG
ncbi:YjfK family protein [Microbulbifer sp. 2205BS26-8]|uniref:YjfK family protein n=1 Tax=Microbulbifer sp. 2205BS26-8 TaxID=3064386 RepID=UPI00273F2FF2|nr:YjfK family protein [Microbulbifer sp. 2205BS26-8]MDP5208697.1 YjfK family protein [Microbulbifer sp. 2205BS26-8]